MNPLNTEPTHPFNRVMNKLGGLLVDGMATELDYMGDDAEAARALEAELIADAEAGVDVRARLVGWACGEGA